MPQHPPPVKLVEFPRGSFAIGQELKPRPAKETITVLSGMELEFTGPILRKICL